MLDPELIGLLTRLTARLSALAFAVYLLSCGWVALSRKQQSLSPWPARLLLAFLAVHTIHLTMVMMLNSSTHGAIIADMGGWHVAILIGTLFYVAMILVWRVERVDPGGRTALARFYRVVALIVVWGIFAQAYFLRLTKSWWFVAIALALLVALVLFVVSLFAGRRTA